MVTIYTLPTCGTCRMIKMKMQQKNIPYQESNDINSLQEKINVERVPVLKINDETFLTTPTEINQWINNYKG